MTVNKIDLVKTVMQESTLDQEGAVDFINQFFETIIHELETTPGVKVSKFGNFIIRNKASRLGRNPRTKIEHIIKARRVVSFKAGTTLKELLNGINT